MSSSPPHAAPSEALTEFERFLHKRGLERNSMPPRKGVAAMLDFFRTTKFRFDGDDYLLFQYGTYDWGEGAHFELDITRQFAIDHSDDHSAEDDCAGIWHLSLTFKYDVTPELIALGDQSQWCNTDEPDVTSAFERFIEDSPGYKAVRDRPGDTTSLDYEDAC